MNEIQVQVSIPEHSAKIADALHKVVLDVAQAKRGGASGLSLIGGAVADSIKAFAEVVHSVGGLNEELHTDPFAVCEAFALAGFAIGRALHVQAPAGNPEPGAPAPTLVEVK